jgi:hypothetical protein
MRGSRRGIAVVLLLLVLSATGAENPTLRVPLWCRGEAPMTVSFGAYGLVTRQGQCGAGFEVGTAVQGVRLPEGGRVCVWRFADGARLYRVVDGTRYFFVARRESASAAGVLRPCRAGEARVQQPLQLPWLARQP